MSPLLSCLVLRSMPRSKPCASDVAGHRNAVTICRVLWSPVATRCASIQKHVYAVTCLFHQNFPKLVPDTCHSFSRRTSEDLFSEMRHVIVMIDRSPFKCLGPLQCRFLKGRFFASSLTPGSLKSQYPQSSRSSPACVTQRAPV